MLQNNLNFLIAVNLNPNYIYIYIHTYIRIQVYWFVNGNRRCDDFSGSDLTEIL